MKKGVIKKLPALLLALLLIFHPALTGYALSEAEEPVEPAVEESSGESTNEAAAEQTESATVANENEANVENNADVEANTGENEIIPEDNVDEGGEEVADSNSEEQSGESEEGTATSDSGLTGEEETGDEIGDSSEENGEEVELSAEEGDGEEAEAGGATAINEDTLAESESTASASLIETTEVANVNDADVENNVDTTAQTGENQTSGDNSQANTGEAEAQTDAANVVNTNIVGEDFWQVIINQFEDSQESLDLSTIEGIENLDADFISVLAANLNTGSESTNLALASLLCLFAVYNDNTATLINNLDLLASSGENQITGNDGTIQTGDAEALLNLFNMVNTNLIGSDWFFGIINLFGELEGDIILPYELAFLGEENGEGTSSTVAANIEPGEGSANQATAEAETSLNVCNINEADLENNVTVLANSGRNEIIGDGEIETGDADANLNLFNMVNTNIVGSRWLLLVINNFGEWVGDVIGWWGSILSIGNTTLVWVQLPPLDDGKGGTTMALNADTGEDSNNLALAQNQNSTTIENYNQATVENNVSVVADTGNNKIEGNSANIQTGNAQAFANIFNLINTNIIGNHWYFCMINIFDRFIGNIMFHREPEPYPPPSPEKPSAGTEGVAAAGGPPGPPECHDQPPGGAPRLISATAGVNSVTLVWEKAPDPVSYYLIAYGESPGNYLYGNPNVGGPETTSYTVGSLSGGKTYYFVVRAGNGCAPGPFSNELAAKSYGGVLEGAATGFLPGILGVQAAEGEGEAGDVAGAQSRPLCPWWLIMSLIEAGLLGAYYWFAGKKKRKFWWLIPVGLAILAFAGDQYLAHRFFTPSRFCQWMWLWSLLAAALPTGIYLYLTKK